MKNYLEYLNESPTVFFLCTPDKGWPVEFVTKNVKELFGYTAQDFLSKKISFFDCIHEEDKAKVFETLTSISNTNQEKYEFEPYRIRTKYNKILWVQDITKIIRDENSIVTHYQCFLTDISKQKEINRHLKIINENVLVSTTDLEGKIIKYSDKFKNLSGFSQEELIGNSHNIMKHEDNDDAIYKNLWETITQGKVWSGEHKNVSKDGKIFWVENVITPNFDDDGIIETYTSVYTDITARKEISELLISDPLTNLYNRRHFNHVFRTELKRSRRHQHNFVLMMIDIDFFKQFNDTYGHHEGDLALVSVSNNLQNSLHRPEDSVFRLGGEEFCVITSDISEKGIVQFANKIRANVENLHIVHQENKISEYLTISIGVKNVDNDIILDYDDIYKLADDALYKAKEEGRNRVVVI